LNFCWNGIFIVSWHFLTTFTNCKIICEKKSWRKMRGLIFILEQGFSTIFFGVSLKFWSPYIYYKKSQTWFSNYLQLCITQRSSKQRPPVNNGHYFLVTRMVVVHRSDLLLFLFWHGDNLAYHRLRNAVLEGYLLFLTI